jgi:hypothetical protein
MRSPVRVAGRSSGVVLLVLLMLGACSPAPRRPDRGRVSVPGPGPRSLRVSELIRSADTLVGEVVEVRGACAGWGGPAPGPPPLTRSDWQLQEDSVAVWVSGPLPRGCDPVNPSLARVYEIRARVACDTLTAGGRGEPAVRHFLKRRTGG